MGPQLTQHNQPGLLGYLPNKAADLLKQKQEEGKRETERQIGKRGRTERDEVSDCALPHRLEVHSPLETVAMLELCVPVQL